MAVPQCSSGRIGRAPVLLHSPRADTLWRRCLGPRLTRSRSWERCHHPHLTNTEQADKAVPIFQRTSEFLKEEEKGPGHSTAPEHSCGPRSRRKLVGLHFPLLSVALQPPPPFRTLWSKPPQGGKGQDVLEPLPETPSVLSPAPAGSQQAGGIGRR